VGCAAVATPIPYSFISNSGQTLPIITKKLLLIIGAKVNAGAITPINCIICNTIGVDPKIIFSYFFSS
jgi:hypothetical protein